MPAKHEGSQCTPKRIMIAYFLLVTFMSFVASQAQACGTQMIA